MAGMTCTARGNLAACIRKVKERQKCKFCGKRSVDLYHCNACGEYFCLKSPTQLIIPGSNPPRHFRIDGPFCWHLVHGYSNWNECAPWQFRCVHCVHKLDYAHIGKYKALISTRVRHVLLSYADIGNKKAEQQKCEVQVLGPCIEVIWNL